MASFNQTPSAVSAVQSGSFDKLTREAFASALSRTADKVFQRVYDAEKQGMNLIREGMQPGSRNTATFQSWRLDGGLVPQNRDGDNMASGSGADGFSYTSRVYTYRKNMAYERELYEQDDRGIVSARTEDLSRSGTLTIENIIADIYNRGVDPATAPILADDGLALVDSGRPSPNPAGGTWSNLETASAVTTDSVFTAWLNARLTKADDGAVYPRRIKAVVCRPNEAKAVWEVRNSAYRPTDALNVNNLFKEWKEATFDVMVYDYLTTANIYYLLADPKSMDNELQLMWAAKPSFETWGDNPDVVNLRIRFRVGAALGCPKKFIRGGAVV